MFELSVFLTQSSSYGEDVSDVFELKVDLFAPCMPQSVLQPAESLSQKPKASRIITGKVKS